MGQAFDALFKPAGDRARTLHEPRSLPLREIVALGDQRIDVLVVPLRDTDGTFLGPMATWENVTEKLRQSRVAAERSALVENAPINIMMADRDFKITYINPASLATLKKIENLLPIKADQILGQSIDIFHKNPAYQRGLLADPKSLPRRANIRIGEETLDLLVSATYDDKGEFMGPMVTWEIVTQRIRAEKEKAELDCDTTAVNQVLGSLAAAKDTNEAISIALNSVKEAYAWAYSSYWTRDAKEGVLKFNQESGTVNEEFRRATMSARFREGEGLSGRAWKNRELFFVENIGDMKDCCRAPVAVRAGVKSGVCFPIIVHGEVLGTMDFFTTEVLYPSQQRLEALRNIGRLVSQSLERIMDAQELRNNVANLLNVVESAAGGDLTKPVAVTGSGAICDLAKGLESMLNDLRNMIGQVVESSAQFTEGSRIVSESSQTLAHGSQTQSASIEEMSAAIEELVRSIEAVKNNSGEANRVAVDTNSLAEEGGRAVQKSVEAMQLIKTSSEQIGDIVQVISEIASQTNLLALNAAIEAARAGEHGLGFAVVADEVRKLAERSSGATKEISALIKESTRRVEEGANLSESTGTALTKIIQGVQATAAKISEIAHATVEQSRSAQEVANAIQNISQVTDQVASGGEELASSSEELGAQAAGLRDLVSRFKTM
ncbi:MAG: methyl-accepting chemotaxis protein [Pirellulales bacterium]